MQAKRKDIQHALDTLDAIHQMFQGNNPVYPGALLLDDEREICEHVEESIKALYNTVVLRRA